MILKTTSNQDFANQLTQAQNAAYGTQSRFVTQDFDRQQISRLYRVARVLSHVATNGKIVIEADVPRRFIERLTTPAAQETQENSVDAD